jgi:hypothetical protein
MGKKVALRYEASRPDEKQLKLETGRLGPTTKDWRVVPLFRIALFQGDFTQYYRFDPKKRISILLRRHPGLGCLPSCHD